MSDLVERLKRHESQSYGCQDCYGQAMDDAAARIERLETALQVIAALTVEPHIQRRAQIALNDK